MSVALDAMVMIWGLQSPGAKRGNPRQTNLAEMQRRAHILLDILEEEKQTVIVPSVLVGELLAGIDPKDHDEFIATIQARFFCPPFDVKAAAVAAKLWIQHRGLPKARQLERRTLKADVMIVASSKIAGATRFYSHDPRARSLAEAAGLQALDLPTHHPNLFVDAELREQSDEPKKGEQ